MNKQITEFGLALVIAAGISVMAYAHDDEPAEIRGHSTMKHDMKPMPGMFLVKKEIDGYQVSFHVMKAPDGMQHGGSHNLMVKIEQDGKPITNALVNSKSIHPDGTSESKMMLPMGDWYVAGYDLGHEGQHQLLILFKTADGKKRFGGVYYPNNTSKKLRRNT